MKDAYKLLCTLVIGIFLVVIFATKCEAQLNGNFKKVWLKNVTDSTVVTATPQNGQLYYNQQTNLFKGYQNGAWLNLITSPSVAFYPLSGNFANTSSQTFTLFDGSTFIINSAEANQHIRLISSPGFNVNSTTISGFNDSGTILNQLIMSNSGASYFSLTNLPLKYAQSPTNNLDGLSMVHKNYVDSLVTGVTGGGTITTSLDFAVDTVNIGAWDMDADNTISVTLPTTAMNVLLFINANIVQDNGTSRTLLLGNGNSITPDVGTVTGREIFLRNETSNNIQILQRVTGSRYDSVNYNDTGISRGFITIVYLN